MIWIIVTFKSPSNTIVTVPSQECEAVSIWVIWARQCTVPRHSGEVVERHSYDFGSTRRVHLDVERVNAEVRE
jgi:hypothetical protein